jgi:hypothetical protein
MVYPLATKTFSVIRKTNVTNASGNITPAGPATIASGVSIYLRDLNGMLEDEKSGQTLVGSYRGQTFPTQDIRVNDVLADETENDVRGKPVQYRVNQATKLVLYLKLHLTRIQVGT